MPNPCIALIVSEIAAFIQMDRQTNMARSTQLVILTKNISVANAFICLLHTFRRI